MGSKVDLHMHSHASDGSDSVPELLQKLRRAGIHTFAVTDHDTVAGALEMERLVGEDMEFFMGIEFSCVCPAGKCHILGYDFDPRHPAFREALEAGRRLREEKLGRRLDFLKESFGITLTEAEMTWLLGQKSPGKPHLGRILLDRGLAPDLSAAIGTYVSPCPGGEDRIPAELAVRAILAAGGIPVWAHPLGGEGERHLTEGEFSALLAQLKQSGIRGLECWYSRYSPGERAFLREQAEGLLISGGSDYHGINKKNIHPGKLGAEDPPVDPEQLTVLRELEKRRR